MTTQEAKDKLYMQWQDFLEHYVDYAGISDAYQMAFKALEQMDALDRMRVEFINRYPRNYAGEFELGGSEAHFSLNDVLDTIDRYRK